MRISQILNGLFLTTVLFSETGNALRCGDYVRRMLDEPLISAATDSSSHLSRQSNIRRPRSRQGNSGTSDAQRLTIVKPKLNSHEYIEKLDQPFEVKNEAGLVVGASLKEALSNPEVQQMLQAQQHSRYKILLRAKIPEADGGGQLRLTTLNTGPGNLAYNHVELVALLKVNPELANELGIFRVEGFDNMAWIADMPALNHRMLQLAKKYGYQSVKWDYGEAQGVVSTMPYLQLLKNGKFPFSGEADVNLAVHDGMHAVAFAVMNITPGGRQVLDVARSRNEVILNIHSRLSELPDGAALANKFVESIAKHISPDSLERTMLLTIILTGNYDYFSASAAAGNPMRSTPQNRELTQKRILELLKLYRDGQITFATALERLIPEGSEGYPEVRRIFVEEIRNLKKVDESVLEKAATDILAFIPDYIFTSSDTTGKTKPSIRFPDVGQSAGPETLTAN